MSCYSSSGVLRAKEPKLYSIVTNSIPQYCHAPQLVPSRLHHDLQISLDKEAECVNIVNRMKPTELTRLREKMGLNQAQLARELGVSRAAVSQWESGKRGIGNVLALALDCLAERKRRRGHAKSRK